MARSIEIIGRMMSLTLFEKLKSIVDKVVMKLSEQCFREAVNSYKMNYDETD